MRRIMAAAALAAALAAAGASAQYFGMGPGMMGPGPFGSGHPMARGGPAGPQGVPGSGIGMMGAYAYEWLGLTPAQREAIAAIESGIWQQHWALMRGYGAGGPRSYEEMVALRNRMLESMLDARRRIEAVLTDEQRARLRELWGCPA